MRLGKVFYVLRTVTAVLVCLTVVAVQFLVQLIQSCSGCGTLGVFVLLIVGTPTLISIMVTIGYWMFQRNRSTQRSLTILENNR